VLSGQGDLAVVTALIEARFGERAPCPHCQSMRVGPWGRASGLRRYRCRDCGKSFNALTGTPLARLRKRSAWKAAAQCGVSVPTSFRWRHRFLERPKDIKAETVTGMVKTERAG
jgi:transposase-like protein